MGKAWKRTLGALVAVAFVVAAGAGYYLYLHRDELPNLPNQDIDQKNHEAGHVERFTGAPLARPVTPADYPGHAREPGAQAESALTPLKEGSSFFLGSLFQLKQGSGIQAVTTGNYIFALDGEGEYVLEDARASSDGNQHTIYWYVKKGTFRAKPHDYDPSNHMLQVTTDTARIFVRKGEVGLKVTEGGHGTIWMMSGKGVVVWNDGKRKELGLKGMDYL